MAEPGDPPPTNDPANVLADEHDDDLIGFASPASLEGRLRQEPEPEPEPEPELEDAPTGPLEDEPLPPEPAPVTADSIFAPSREFSTRKRGRDTGPRPRPAGGSACTPSTP